MARMPGMSRIETTAAKSLPAATQSVESTRPDGSDRGRVFSEGGARDLRLAVTAEWCGTLRWGES